jgi:hypothetical protein
MRAHLYEYNIGACLSQTNGNGLANASRATGDEGGLTLEGEKGGGHNGGLECLSISRESYSDMPAL